MKPLIIALLCAGVWLAGCSKDAPTPPDASQQASSAPATTASAPAADPSPNTAQQAPAPQPSETTTLSEPPPPSAPPAPMHNYEYVDNGLYGYEEALSDTDEKAGVATKPLRMFRYIGFVNGRYIVEAIENNVTASRASCEPPCQFAKILVVNTFGGSSSQVIRLAPNSIIASVLLDAMSGQLEPSRSPVNYLFPASWSPAPAQAPAAQAANQTPITAPAPSVPAPVAPEATSASAAVASSTQPSFDCSKAKSDAEHLICANADLATADRELADIFARAKAAVADKAAFKERTRTEWNYREQNCHDKDCLVRWYADQKAALQHIADTGAL